MKIALLTWSYPPRRIGGTEIASQNIAKYLASRGHNITVITRKDEGLPKESIENGFRVIRIGCPSNRLFRFVIFCFKAASFLRKLRPDIIHAQAMHMGLCALITSNIIHKPYIVWARGLDIYSYQFNRLIMREIFRKAGAVLALTEYMKKEILKYQQVDIIVIGNGIDIRKFGKLSREESRSWLGIKPVEKVVVFVGSLSPVKGVRYLLEAMSIIKREIPVARLLIVGDGTEKPILKTKAKSLNIENTVTFYGHVDNDEVPKYMAASDVFVLPSLSEGFPNVIAEAMAAGLPIICTKVGGLSEIVTEGKNGFLVESENPAQLARQIISILTDDGLKQEMVYNNQAWAKMNSWERVVEKLEKIYAQVAKEK